MWAPAVRDFALVMCARPHNLLHPPPIKILDQPLKRTKENLFSPRKAPPPPTGNFLATPLSLLVSGVLDITSCAWQNGVNAPSLCSAGYMMIGSDTKFNLWSVYYFYKKYHTTQDLHVNDHVISMVIDFLNHDMN